MEFAEATKIVRGKGRSHHAGHPEGDPKKKTNSMGNRGGNRGSRMINVLLCASLIQCVGILVKICSFTVEALQMDARHGEDAGQHGEHACQHAGDGEHGEHGDFPCDVREHAGGEYYGFVFFFFF